MQSYWPIDKRYDTQVWATSLVELALSRGAKLDALLRGTGLFKQDLTQVGHRINAQQLAQLIRNCQKHTRSQDLSFMLGRRLLAAQHSPVIQLLQHAQNLTQVARVFQLYQDVIFPYCFGTIKRHKSELYFVLNPAVQSEAQAFMFETLCAFIYHASKTLCGKTIPYRFYFECDRPRNIYQFEENLGPRLAFNQPVNWIKLDAQHLLTEVAPEPSLTRTGLLQQCRRMRKNTGQVGVLKLLYNRLQSGDVVNLEQASELLAISPATLKRKLKTTGVSFQQLQDTVRKQQAIFDLVVKKQKNGEVAKTLKFNDVTNFRRAFKRWTGLTPAQLRSD